MPCQTYRQSLYSITILTALALALLAGLLALAPIKERSNENVNSKPAFKPVNLADLPDAELEQLAADVLSTLTAKHKLITQAEAGKNEALSEPPNRRQIRLGLKNARRLLPLAKRLTLETLRDRVKTSPLTREARLIASVNHLVLDQTLSDRAEVRDEDLSKIWIGPDYAIGLTSDDEAVVLLSHELTHIAARSGRLNKFIESVTTTAQLGARIESNSEQKEELACDFTAAEVLKRFIALHPTSELNSMRFSLPFGYEAPAKRLTRAWADFCASYTGDSRDDEHLSQDQTLRSLIVLDQDLKAFVPDDALVTRFCR